VARVGGPHARDPRPVLGALQPPGKLRPDAPAEDAAAFETQSFAGHDQHHAQVALGGVGDEMGHGALGRGQGHAVQIELGLRRALSLGQRPIDLAIEGPLRKDRRPPGRRHGRSRHDGPLR